MGSLTVEIIQQQQINLRNKIKKRNLKISRNIKKEKKHPLLNMKSCLFNVAEAKNVFEVVVKPLKPLGA